MALNKNESIWEHMIDVPLDPAYTGALESGMVMVASSNIGADGQQLCRPCGASGSASSSEIVLGVLKLSENSQAAVPSIELLDVPAVGPYTVTLKELPTAAVLDVEIFNVTDSTAVTAVSGAPAANEATVSLTTGLVTAHSGLAGKRLRFTYRYLITAQELARRGGRRSVNMGAERVFNQCTIVRGNCKLLLSNFVVTTVGTADSTTRFAPSVAITTHTYGTVKVGTVGGAGTAVGTCFQAPVLKLTPGIEQAFIGLEADFG